MNQFLALLQKLQGYPQGLNAPQLNDVLKWDGTAWVANPEGGGGSIGATGNYTCDPNVVVFDLVCLDLVVSPTGDYINKADASAASGRPLIGVVIERPTVDTAQVLYNGELDGFIGLTPGATYYLSETPGGIVATAPTTVGSIQQRVGFARSTTCLVIMINQEWVEL